MAIGHLADRLRGGEPFVQAWPRHEPVLTRDGAARIAGTAEPQGLRHRRAERPAGRQGARRGPRLPGLDRACSGRLCLRHDPGPAAAGGNQAPGHQVDNFPRLTTDRRLRRPSIGAPEAHPSVDTVMAAKGQFLQRFGKRATVRRRGRLRACADDGSGARAIWRVRPAGGGSFDSFFSPFSAPRAPVERPVDSSRAPSPRKLDVQPTGGSVLVLGDSMADWLAYGLEDALGDPPDLAVVRKNRATSGLIRYDCRNEKQDWAQVIREAIAATKPKFIVMMVGLNDRMSIRDRVPPSTAPRARRGRKPRRRAAAPASAPEQPATPPDAKPEARTPSRRRPNSRRSPRPTQSRRAAPPRPIALYEFRTDEWAAYLHQADRRHDRRAEKRRRAGVLGRPAVDPRAEIDERHAVSQRPLPRPRGEGRHQLHRRVGRLRRRQRPLHPAGRRTSKARPAGCAPATACISPGPARASSRIISSVKSAAC